MRVKFDLYFLEFLSDDFASSRLAAHKTLKRITVTTWINASTISSSLKTHDPSV